MTAGHQVHALEHDHEADVEQQANSMSIAWSHRPAVETCGVSQERSSRPEARATEWAEPLSHRRPDTRGARSSQKCCGSGKPL